MTHMSDASNKHNGNIRNSTAVTSPGSIPRWLKDITEGSEGSNKISNRNGSKGDGNGQAYNVRQTPLYRFDFPTRICYTDNLEESIATSSKNSVKYGRRSSLPSHTYAASIPKEFFVGLPTCSVPCVDDTFDSKSIDTEAYQQNLEKSWSSLNYFKHNHKGRLHNSKSFTNTKYTLTDLNGLDGSVPSLIEHLASSRSKHVMSNYMPFHDYINLKEASESQRVNKSQSSQNISCFSNTLSMSGTTSCDTNLCPPIERLSKIYDPYLEQNWSDYIMKNIKENELREQIITELLAEDKKINNILSTRRSDTERYLIANSFEEPSVHRSLYTRDLEYGSQHGSKCNMFDSDYNSETVLNELNNTFVIPELPVGQSLIIDILSTWGDKYYVGLNGIEIFDKSGSLANINKISAIPPDVNILPECDSDPRIVANLLDGVNRTQDDMHIWLAPFDAGCSHIITIDFKEITTVAMIRIWNYNKSRIHSYRGVRDIVMLLDGFPIFKGEIAKANGGILGGLDAFGDTILFTTDEKILENISKHDPSFSDLTTIPEVTVTFDRPIATSTHSRGRPITGQPKPQAPQLHKDQILLGARKIDLILLSNWGHPEIIGLTSLEVMQGEDVLSLNKNSITCNVERKSIFMNRLINSENITTDSRSMWSTIFRNSGEIFICIDFQTFTYVSGLRVWNYNESLEKSYAGVRTMKIFLDGIPLRNSVTGDDVFLLRRAPGNEHYDFAQDIKFHENVPIKIEKPNRDDCISMPEGFVFQIIIYSTWGDQYYCGLNGIELYNENGNKIVLEDQNICAYPESINVLPNSHDDIRTPEKLIDGINDDDSSAHSWLAPVIHKHLNRIYVVMDHPITVSYMKIWNYSKSLSRGVKDFGILVDDLLIYTGTLNKYSRGSDDYQVVLFTENRQILGENRANLKRHSNVVHDILFSNELKTFTSDGRTEDPDPALRPFTSVSLFNIGHLSFSS